jgi:hypothetical protein
MTIPGVGAVVAMTYRSAIDQPERCAKSKAVGAHFGLTPKKYQSGEVDRTGRISKVGDAMVRTALFEAANVMLARAVRFSTLQAIAQPVGSWENMGSLGGSIAGQASTLRQYDPIADRLFALFRGFLDGGSLLRDRTEHLMRIVREAGRGESLAVVCRSVQIAERCRAASLEDALLSRFDWLSLEGLRRQAPYDRVVVPGWIDRLAMRELANNGYGASMDLVLLPFERRWFDATTTAMRRWERRL